MKISEIICEEVSSQKERRVYVSFDLDERSRQRLFELAHPKYDTLYTHHVTLKFGIPESQAGEFIERVSNMQFVVTGYTDTGEDLDFYTVHTNHGNKRPDGSYYHCTASLTKGVRKPVDSNRYITQDGGVPSTPFKSPVKITGKIVAH